MAPNPQDARVTSTEPMPADEARWIRLQKITYSDPLGRSRTWESAERQTRPKSSRTDGVGVVAILNKPSGPHLLLQKQFRPPLSQVTIELPSGLIDEGETPAQCAVRELKEETGYVATVPSSSDPASASSSSSLAESFLMFNDPGFCNTNTQIVTVEVDLADPRNQPGNLRPELEENEFIECFEVPLDSLWGELARLERDEGFAVDARVGTLAMGLEIARKFGAGGKNE